MVDTVQKPIPEETDLQTQVNTLEAEKQDLQEQLNAPPEYATPDITSDTTADAKTIAEGGVLPEGATVTPVKFTQADIDSGLMEDSTGQIDKTDMSQVSASNWTKEEIDAGLAPPGTVAGAPKAVASEVADTSSVWTQAEIDAGKAPAGTVAGTSKTATVGSIADYGDAETADAKTSTSLTQQATAATATGPELSKQALDQKAVADLLKVTTATAQTAELTPEAKAKTIKGEVSEKMLVKIDNLDITDDMLVAAHEAKLDGQSTAQAVQRAIDVKETVQGQLAQMFADSPNGETPLWAKPAVAQVENMLAARGFSNSTVAKSELYNAIITSAMPIATADAQTYHVTNEANANRQQQVNLANAAQAAQFQLANVQAKNQAEIFNATQKMDVAKLNLSKDQAVAFHNAQQYSDLLKLNLTNEQQTELFNAANEWAEAQFNASQKQATELQNATAKHQAFMQNLTNEQQQLMFKASTLANMDITNLNNRQQAAMQNAQSFLQLDLANLSNQQQTAIFNAQQRQQKMLSDEGFENARRNTNAASENQTRQFYDSLQNTINMHNAASKDAMTQYQLTQEFDADKFNAQTENNRLQFNAQNEIVIAQANADWRRNIATMENEQANKANMLNAQNAYNLSGKALDFLWQEARDANLFANQQTIAAQEADAAKDAALYSAFGSILAKYTEGQGAEANMFTIGGTMVGGMGVLQSVAGQEGYTQADLEKDLAIGAGLYQLGRATEGGLDWLTSSTGG